MIDELAESRTGSSTTAGETQWPLRHARGADAGLVVEHLVRNRRSGMATPRGKLSWMTLPSLPVIVNRVWCMWKLWFSVDS